MAVTAVLFRQRRRAYTFHQSHHHPELEKPLYPLLKPLSVALALLGLVLVPERSEAAADAAAIKAVVDRAIPPLMAQYGVPGIAVAVTVDGKAMFFNYGVASKEKKTPVSEHTLFELGSISKTFAATLATYAQVTGKLSLDDHPDRYMPQLKGSPIAAATVLNLGTYSAGGLPLQFPDEVTDDNMAAYFKDFKPEAAPGAVRRYSNPSIGLLGHVTALALKQSFADAAEHTLFPALGLKETYVRVPQKAMANYAWGYDDDGKPRRIHPSALHEQFGGIKSSTADMIVLLQKNMDTTGLSGPIRAAVEQTHVGYYQIDGNMVQGLGWEQYRRPLSLQHLLAGNSEKLSRKSNPAVALTPPQPALPGTLFNKTGGTGGFSSYAAFVPDQKIGVVILANRPYPIPERVKAAHAILEQLGPLN
jgi:beta-lactamase class C